MKVEGGSLKPPLHTYPMRFFTGNQVIPRKKPMNNLMPTGVARCRIHARFDQNTCFSRLDCLPTFHKSASFDSESARNVILAILFLSSLNSAISSSFMTNVEAVILM